ncbi:hypothetical protein CRW82_08885 [Salmonella enterica subsp. enterica serovar Newport]|uniref:Uncharacterized protein n=1 Tax=Salmonella enterica TaxID=28901 RepID=A0A403T4R7_SALER|nr:hypothetical protein [Salmonella enterica]ECJ2364031.1 hypothetical protein [Salmonella enterica subsp. diarizonae]ECJ2414070.1 hypothetical protein [Salmonella enterica subsp. diarizonae]EDL3490734.1 hypothetical protein [Salmonella enterica subsp. enterica serovar Newport]MMS78792.1 hypothetical protein [Salmonella enterica]
MDDDHQDDIGDHQNHRHHRRIRLTAYSALFDHGLASKFDQRFAVFSGVLFTGRLVFNLPGTGRISRAWLREPEIADLLMTVLITFIFIFRF